LGSVGHIELLEAEVNLVAVSGCVELIEVHSEAVWRLVISVEGTENLIFSFKAIDTPFIHVEVLLW
jgi:hypothetical protein